MVDGAYRREYPNYESYIRNQSAKLNVVGADVPNNRMVEVISQRLSALGIMPSKSVLCLGARAGGECEGFARAGYFAAGVDLNPGKSNRCVVHGDFHELQYRLNIVDLVFSDALDHALDLEKVLSEVSRVLKPDGQFLVDAVLGHADRSGFNPMAEYESYMWARMDDLVDRGFELNSRIPFEHPWPEETLLFRSHIQQTVE